MRAAVRRLLDPTDPNHDPDERWVDVCDSIAHAEPVAQPVAPVAQPVAIPVAPPVVQPSAGPMTQPITQPIEDDHGVHVSDGMAQPVTQPGARANTASTLRARRRESSMMPSRDTASRVFISAAHGTAMVAAARRVFNVSDHNPVERFADLCASLNHPESYLPGETPTPQHTAVVDPPPEPLARQRTQVDAVRSQIQQRATAATRSRTRRDNERLRNAEAAAETSDEDAS